MNTGQGVVMEGCAHSDYCHFNAAYNAGWILDESKFFRNFSGIPQGCPNGFK